MMLFLQAAIDSISADAGWGDYFQMLGALLFVLLLVLVALRYVLPLLPVARNAGGGLIRIRASVPLEARKRLYLVESGGKVLLLASADHAVNLVGTYELADFPETPAPAAPALNFAQLLKRGRS